MQSIQPKKNRWLPVRTRATLLAVLAVMATGARAGELISIQEAGRHGLVRAWFAVMEIDPSRGRLERVLVDDDSIFVLTSRGSLQVLDAATGATRWMKRIGNPDYPSLGPATNAQYVAIVNGSTLYILDRQTGEIEWERQLGSGAGAGPGLTEEMVYVPIINGALEGYPLEDSKKPRWIYQSVGHALVQPVTTSASVFWATDRGYFYVGRGNNPGVRYRIEMEDEITERPAFLAPLVYSVSLDGAIYATNEMTGAQRWRYTMGDSISEAPAALRDRVFICSDKPRMVCFDARDGNVLWTTDRITRFVAASEERVYGTDRFDRLHILDQQTGARLGVLDTHGSSLPIENQQTDRIYLATPTGLIQCLHEKDRAEPLVHSREISKEEAAAGAMPADAERKPQDAPGEAVDETNPFGDEQNEEPDQNNPSDDANPFG